MTIEHACMRVVRKPWGSTDLRPWSDIQRRWRRDRRALVSARRSERARPRPAPQVAVHDGAVVHPGSSGRCLRAIDRFGAWQDRGLVHPFRGARRQNCRRTEAAAHGPAIAGRRSRTARLRTWFNGACVLKDDVIFVPAGTIHAIGPGLVIAEIQQRSDATFRLFDYGRQRELHVDNAVAAAHAGPAECQSVPRRLTDARTLLVASPHFVLERIDLAPKSNWELHAEHETWLLVLEGYARVGLMNVFVGEAIFLEADRTSIKVGVGRPEGSVGLFGHRAQSEPVARSRWAERRFPDPPFFATVPFITGQQRVRRSTQWRRDHDPAKPPGIHRQFAPAPLRNRHLHDRSAAGDRNVTRGRGDLQSWR